MKKRQRSVSLVMGLVLALSLALPVGAADSLETAANRTAAYLLQTVSTPQTGDIGGEWVVLGLARGEYSVPASYWTAYLGALETHVKSVQGILSTRKYTEYARVVLTLTALGKDPTNVAGYDLLAPLGEFSGVLRQGLNGAVWALLALDAGAYDVPQVAGDQATRERYVQEILRRQGTAGGWSLGAGEPDPDITAMALQALAPYREQEAVGQAVARGVTWLSDNQLSDGSFASWDGANAESVAQVILALCRLGIDLEDSRFVKDGHTLLQALLSYQQVDGSFRHTQSGDGQGQMATEQAFLALTGAWRAEKGLPDLYSMKKKESDGTRKIVIVPKGEWPTSFKVLFPQLA